MDDTYKNFSTRMDKYREKVNQQIYVFNPILQNENFAVVWGSNSSAQVVESNIGKSFCILFHIRCQREIFELMEHVQPKYQTQ